MFENFRRIQIEGGYFEPFRELAESDFFEGIDIITQHHQTEQHYEQQITYINRPYSHWHNI